MKNTTDDMKIELAAVMVMGQAIGTARDLKVYPKDFPAVFEKCRVMAQETLDSPDYKARIAANKKGA